MKTAYMIACFLLVLAIMLDVAGKMSYSQASRSRAKRVMAEQSQREAVKADAVTVISRGDRLIMGGLIAFGLGLAFWYASAILKKFDDKRLTPVVPLVLLNAYGLLFLTAS